MARAPIFGMRRRNRPGLDLSSGMKKRLRPSEGLMASSRGVVRASRIMLEATWAEEIQIFWPVME